MRIVRALTLTAIVTVLTVAASAQVSAPQIPPPDEPAIYISSEFVQDDGAFKAVQNVTIDVAGVSIAGEQGRMRGNGRIILQNATIDISPAVATHVRSKMIYRGDKLRDLPQAR
jgi:hypothetical protein